MFVKKWVKLAQTCTRNKNGGGNNLKKPDPPKAKGRSFRMSAKEAKEDEDVVHGSLLFI